MSLILLRRRGVADDGCDMYEPIYVDVGILKFYWYAKSLDVCFSSALCNAICVL